MPEMKAPAGSLSVEIYFSVPHCVPTSILFEKKKKAMEPD